MNLINHWIGGKPYKGTPERVGDVYNPATGEVESQVALASPETVDRVVETASQAFKSWRSVSLAKRATIMFKFWELIDDEKNKQALAKIIANEHGKVLADALGEIARGIEVLEFACGIPHLLKGEFSENISTGVDSYSIRQPVGVVVGITPFNFPCMVPMWMYPIAIACGNTFVLKPSEKDPSAANFMAELLAQAGLPEGVFNVVHGDKMAVDGLLTHPKVNAVSFVGSTPIAKYVYQTGTQQGKRVQALGGAKNHMIVLPDADLEFAADMAVSAAYGSAGQRCMAISTIAAAEKIADPLVDQVRQRVDKLTVGAGLEPESQMGPLITGVARDRILSLIEGGIKEGAELAIDKREVELPERYKNGFFIGPCLFDHVSPTMTIYKEEIFGPVLVQLRVKSYDEAIALVNANPYGNGVAIFTKDGGAARKFQHEVTVGMVGINVPIPVPMAFYSFGGWKNSLFGDTHIHGLEGIHFYTLGKVVTARWPDPSMRGIDLGFPVAE